ncbi:NUDIX domain-containing protein [Arthrobacter sp. Sa2BUA2]|uniref:NUDIX domain-containing protein n=1 Tax=Arthrobacter pullicola TaxID=2762224 RepID=A0ABR8YEU1_9MICC|nr:NUDIX domain-containing protein [Arthrobacter pullicola]MBD8042736.1 NUDIX domain-containing protein [Arthrobacter pullicola]
MTLVGTAATVVLLRDGTAGLEVLLLERPRHTGTFAGAWVFPGGRVDPQDYEAAGYAPPAGAAGPPDPSRDLAAARVAGARETAEETGLLLPPDSLTDLSCWIPPLQAPKRLKTWFFLAAHPGGEVRLNPGELIDSAWLTPAAALARHREGKMLLVAPTFVTLTLLQQDADVASALARAATGPVETFSSRLLGGYEPDAVIAWHGDPEYPDAALAGRPGEGARHRLTMRGSDWRYERS